MEYGHAGYRIPHGFIDVWGGNEHLIEVNGKTYRFEDSDRFGPSFIKKNGDIAVHQPGERHPFWGAYEAWRKQGRQMKDGRCVWRPFKDEILEVDDRGRIIRVAQEGEDGGMTIVIRATNQEPTHE